MDSEATMGIDADEGANPRIKPESGARIFELARQHCTAEQWGKSVSYTHLTLPTILLV